MNNKIRKIHNPNARYRKLNKPLLLRDHHFILKLETTDGSEDVTLVPFEHSVYYSHLSFKTCRPVFRKIKVNGN